MAPVVHPAEAMPAARVLLQALSAAAVAEATALLAGRVSPVVTVDLVVPGLFQLSPAYLTAAVVVVPRTQILAVQLLLAVAWEAAVRTE